MTMPEISCLRQVLRRMHAPFYSLLTVACTSTRIRQIRTARHQDGNNPWLPLMPCGCSQWMALMSKGYRLRICTSERRIMARSERSVLAAVICQRGTALIVVMCTILPHLLGKFSTLSVADGVLGCAVQVCYREATLQPYLPAIFRAFASPTRSHGMAQRATSRSQQTACFSLMLSVLVPFSGLSS